MKKNLINLLNTKNLQFFSLLALTIYIFYCSLPPYWNRINWSDGYAVGDWIINYEDGGFKRRGLSGTFFMWLSRTSHIDVKLIIFSFVTSIYVLFFLILIYYLKRIRLSKAYWLLLLCPTIIFFSVNDPYAFGRKEILFFLIGSVFLVGTLKNWIKSWWFIISTSFFIFIFTFFHEIFIFYLPYLYIILFIDSLQKKYKIEYKKVIVLLLSSLIPTICIFFYGGDINQGKTWTIIQKYGLNENVMNGIMSWPKEGFGPGKQNALKFAYEHNYATYLFPLLVTYMMFAYFIIKLKNPLINIKKFTLFFVGMLVFSLPLFFLSIDWGRWLNIHFVFTFLIFSQFLPRFTEENNQFPLEKIISKINGKIIISMVLIIVLSSWYTMHHVDKGFTLGKNVFISSFRDFFWSIRHINKYF
jgi:hypothetical protein